MVHPYLRRRTGEEPVTYPHPLLEPALRETLGVILFQEQVLKVARDLAGFTPGQGELLRRTLSNKRAEEAIERFHDTFLDGARSKDVAENIAENVFAMLRAFGGYSFPKSHAAAFAVLVYQSAWLKHYHPAAFYVALLNNQPMGFWSPSVIVHDAKRHGIAIRGVDLHLSDGKCRLEAGAIRLGFNYINGMGEAAIARLETVRETGRFSDLADFCHRTRLSHRVVENLILAGAMDGWNTSRRTLIWELGTLDVEIDTLPLGLPDDTVRLPDLSPAELLAVENQVLGLSSGQHIMALYRKKLTRQGILGSKALERCANGRQVQVAGLVVMHQAPPTAKGFHFITLEDEDGFINVIVRPKVYARYRRVIRSTNLLIVEGEVQRDDSVINLICPTVIPLRA